MMLLRKALSTRRSRVLIVMSLALLVVIPLWTHQMMHMNRRKHHDDEKAWNKVLDERILSEAERKLNFDRETRRFLYLSYQCTPRGFEEAGYCTYPNIPRIPASLVEPCTMAKCFDYSRRGCIVEEQEQGQLRRRNKCSTFTYMEGIDMSTYFPSQISSGSWKMKPMLACNYAIVRFLPYRETGEFVNVGVVLFCPQSGYFDLKLETRKQGRVTDFFPELDKSLFRLGRQHFYDELKRVRELLNGENRRADDQARLSVFRELLKPRESVFRFSEVATILAEDPAATLQDLRPQNLRGKT